MKEVLKPAEPESKPSAVSAGWTRALRDWLRRVRRAVREGFAAMVRAAIVFSDEYRIRYELAACLNFRNAAPYLAEWIEFHLLVGVEHFYLYNNNSEDDYKAALKPYLEMGVVTLLDWPDIPIFPGSYAHCVEHHKHEARWIAFLDDDEFLFPTKHNNLQKLLREYQRYPAVAVHWLMFGSSGHLERPAGLVTESYLRREEGVNCHIKTIVNPRRVVPPPRDPHRWHYQDSEWAVDERRRSVIGAKPLPATADLLRINHYTSKSLKDWERKVKRGEQALMESPYTIELWHEREPALNAVEDRTILRFLPELKRRLESRAASGV